MSSQVLYDLALSQHLHLVSLAAQARANKVEVKRRRRWHAPWRPPHQAQQPLAPMVPTQLVIR
jgi:hypothetical protein